MGLRASIIRIGNSRGIRIPRALIDEAQLGETVELSVVDGALVVRSAARARQDWDAAFEQMAEAGEDSLIDPQTPTDFDKAGWEWPEH
jgi:antitoxin MazE